MDDFQLQRGRGGDGKRRCARTTNGRRTTGRRGASTAGRGDSTVGGRGGSSGTGGGSDRVTYKGEEELVVIETESAPTSQRAPKSQTSAAPKAPTQADVQPPPQMEKTTETSTAEHDYARRNALSIESFASEQALSQTPLVIAKSTPAETAAETRSETSSTPAPQALTTVSAAANDVPAVAASGGATGEDTRLHEAGVVQASTSAQPPPTEKAVSRESTNEFVDAPTGSQSTVVPPTQPPEERLDEPP